jgi:hypothetical protein
MNRKGHNRFEEIEQLENGKSTDKVVTLKQVFKQGKHIVQPAYNPALSWFAGVARLSDEEKKEKAYFVTVSNDPLKAHLNTKFTLIDGIEFDLNDEIQAINWAWIKHLPCVAMSFEEAQRGKALFYVHIEGREAEKDNQKTELAFDALACIMNDPMTNYENRALLLGTDMAGDTPANVKKFLMNEAKKNPSKVLAVYRSKSMKINLLYVKAKQMGLVTQGSDNVVKYGVNILGMSDDQAIAYLQLHEDVMMLLEREVNPDYFTMSTPNPVTAETVDTGDDEETPAAKMARVRDAKKKD